MTGERQSPGAAVDAAASERTETARPISHRIAEALNEGEDNLMRLPLREAIQYAKANGYSLDFDFGRKEGTQVWSDWAQYVYTTHLAKVFIPVERLNFKLKIGHDEMGRGRRDLTEEETASFVELLQGRIKNLEEIRLRIKVLVTRISDILTEIQSEKETRLVVTEAGREDQARIRSRKLAAKPILENAALLERFTKKIVPLAAINTDRLSSLIFEAIEDTDTEYRKISAALFAEEEEMKKTLKMLEQKETPELPPHPYR